LLAYAVRIVGGSMVWFGSSAGVALTALYPEGRSIAKWVRQAVVCAVAYILGFAAMLVYRSVMRDILCKAALKRGG
jgi:hypothetical protein